MVSEKIRVSLYGRARTPVALPLAPATLLTVGRKWRWLAMRFGRVIINSARGLGAEVSALGVEVLSADSMGTLRATEFHAALDALDSVGFH